MRNKRINWENIKNMSNMINIGEESFVLATQMKDELFPYSLKLKICSKIPFIGGVLVKDILQDSKVYQGHETTHKGCSSDIRNMAIDMFLAASSITMPGISKRAAIRLVKDLCSSSAV